MEIEIEEDVRPPEARQRVPRMCDELRALQPGQSVALPFDFARCLVAYGRHHGWVTRQRKFMRDNEPYVRVWRIS